MSKKRAKKYKSKNNKTRNILILVLLVLLAVLAVVVIKKKGDTAFDEDAATEEMDEADALEFPYELEDGKIIVHSLFAYEGINLDTEQVTDGKFAAIEVENNSGTYVSEGDISAVMADGSKYTFRMESIPPATKVLLFETSGAAYEDATVGCQSFDAKVSYDDYASLKDGSLKIKVDGTTVKVKNKTEETLEGLQIVCHNSIDGELVGGKAHVYAVDTISPGKKAKIDATECMYGDVVVTEVRE